MAFLRSCVSFLLRPQEGDGTFAVSHGRPAKHPLYKCLSTSGPYDNKFHVDELIGGGDEDLRHFRSLSFSSVIFL